MAKYLFVANYSPEGIRGVLQEGGTARATAVQALAESVGGSIESFHFALGGDDAFVLCDLPSVEAAAAVALTVGASGSAKVRTISLLTPEEVNAAVRLSPTYRAPGTDLA